MLELSLACLKTETAHTADTVAPTPVTSTGVFTPSFLTKLASTLPYSHNLVKHESCEVSWPLCTRDMQWLVQPFSAVPLAVYQSL